jgi:hypothetical protein
LAEHDREATGGDADREHERDLLEDAVLHGGAPLPVGSTLVASAAVRRASGSQARAPPPRVARA